MRAGQALKQAADGAIFKPKGIGNRLMGYFAFYYVSAAFEFRVLLCGLSPSLVGNSQGIGQGCIGQGYGGGSGNSPRHIAHGIMHHAVDGVRGIEVGCLP